MSSITSTAVTAVRSLGTGPASATIPDDLTTARLTPAQHASLILPPGAKGMLVLGRRDREYVLGKDGSRVSRKVYLQAGATADEVVRAVESFDDGVSEILVAMNAFRPRGALGADYHSWPDKRLGNLLQLRSVWVEFDHYKRGEYGYVPAHEMPAHILARTHQERIPAPSYIVSSGRGIHLVWLTEGVPSVALPAWKAVQARLAEVFNDMGPDTTAAAPTGNLRLVGTSNHGRDVRMLWPATVGKIHRYSFRGIASEILPYSPEQCREYKAKTEERKALRRAANAVREASGQVGAGLTVDTYRAAIEADLWKLLHHRYPADVPFTPNEEESGEHGRFLFAFARLWACRLGPDALKAEVEKHAKRLGYRSPQDAVRQVGTIIRKRRAYHERQPGSAPRKSFFYRFGPHVLVRDFRIDEDLARSLDLRILRPLSMKAERAAQRQAKVRVARGAKPRADAKAERLALGRQAIALRDAEGLSRPQLCQRLGVKPTLLDKAIREAKSEVTVAPASNAKPRLPQPSRVSSRYIADAPEASSSLEAGHAAAYTPDVRDVAPLHEDKRPAGSEKDGGPSHVGADVQTIRHTPFMTEYRTATERYGILRLKDGPVWIETRIELGSEDVVPVPATAHAATSSRVLDVVGRLAREASDDRRRVKRRIA